MTSGTLHMSESPVPPEPGETGWKDTVRGRPGIVTRIIVRFEATPAATCGTAIVLEHAANEMMRPFEVV